MSHTRATPNTQRPTLDELRIHDRFVQRHQRISAVIQGLWEDSEEPFKIQVTGDYDDVLETFETLKENGNLMGLDMHTMKNGEPDR